MSLVVWLPLNGNLRNQGCSKITAANDGATIINDGKLGQAYHFGDGNASSTGIWLNDNLTSLGSTRSICAWIRPKGNHYHYSGAILSSGDWNSTRWAFCVEQNNQGFTGFDDAYSSYYGTNIPINVWTHLCVTVDNGVTKFYKNGVYLGYQNRGSGGLASDDANYTTVGRETYAGGYFTFNGDICDVRVYDHCLSATEVKDISKGLVLHYKLNTITKGLIDTGYKWFSIYDNYGVASSLTQLDEKFNGYPVYRESMTPNSSCVSDYRASLVSHGVYNGSYTFKGSTKYVYYIYFRPVTNKADIRVGGIASNIGGWTEILPVPVGNGWYKVGQYRSGSDTSDRSDAIFTSFYSPSAEADVPIVIDWGPSFLIEGTTEIPPIDDFGNSIVADCSGFGNNGEIYGNLIPSENSPRYNNSANFIDSDCSIKIGDLSTIVPEGQFTFNCWFRKNTNEWSSKGWETIFGGPGGFELEGKYSGTNSPSLVLYNWGGNTVSYSLDTWNMITFTLTPSETKLYLNGELKATGSGGSIPSGDYFIGAWRSAYEQNCRGYFSDVRIYSTILSDNDILNLYKIPTTINSNKSIDTCEFEEDTYNLFTLENINENALGKVGFTDRNGEQAVALPAHYFYFGENDDRNIHLQGKFLPNTQYKFDFWIDYDDIIYEDINRMGGIVVFYTDGSADYSLCDSGDYYNHAGWKHKMLITDPSKSVKGIHVYYWTSTPAYYRYDSIIKKITSTDIQKSGVISTGQFRENTDGIKIYKDGHIDSNQIIEI